MKDSSSKEQQTAEKIIIDQLEKEMKIKFERNAKIKMGDSHIEPDIYYLSELRTIIGEVYIHFGKAHSGQINKVSTNILKMLLFEKKTGITAEKMIIMCDEAFSQELHKNKWISECIKAFDINIKVIELEESIKDAIVSAQERQSEAMRKTYLYSL